MDQEITKYLQSGEQTEITSEILKIADSINSPAKNFEDKITGIFNFLKSLSYKEENKNDFFRKRTAGEIIKSGFWVGCSDQAIVFISIARAMNIPAIFIETINLDFLKKSKDEQGLYNGHTYSCVYEKEKGWIYIDQTKGIIDVNISNDNRVLFKKGLDSWGIGIKDFKTLKKEWDEFRNKFNK